MPQEAAQTILEALKAGETLTSVLEKLDLGRATITDWKQKDPIFAEQFARARVAGAEMMVDEGQDLLDSATPETAKLVKFQAEYRLKRAACFAPAVFGTKVIAETLNPERAAQQILADIAEAKRRNGTA